MKNKNNLAFDGVKKVIFSILLTAVFISGCTVGVGGNQSPVVAGVFKSVDKGETWFTRNIFLHSGGVGTINGVGVKNFIFDPLDPKTIYLPTVASGLLYSYDTADSWQRLGSLGQGRTDDIAVDPFDKCNLFATKANTLVKSTDCGRTWAETLINSKSDSRLSAVAVDSFTQGIVYAGDSVGDILKSEDEGVNWRVVHRTASPVVKFLINQSDTRIIYAATHRKGIFKSTDGGNSWAGINDGLKKYSGVFEYKHLMFDVTLPDALLYVSKYGLLKTNDGGATWVPITLITPPATTDILAAAISPVNNQEIFYASRSTFYKTSDGGANWITKRLPSRAVPTALSIDPSVPTVLYLGFYIPAE